MQIDVDFDTLLGDLYYGAPWSDPARARPFLRALGKLTRSASVTFVRGDFACPDADISLTVDTEQAQRGRPATGSDPWFQPHWPDLREGGIYRGDEVDLRPLLSCRQDDLVARPGEPAHALVICVAQLQLRGAFLRLSRPARWGGYDHEGLLAIRRIAPHLVHAYRLRSHLKILEAQAAQPTLHHHGMFVLDAQWRWVGGNPIADRMVADGWWQGRRHSHLDGSHAVTRARWKAVQQQMGQEDAQQHVIPVRDAEGALVALANVHAYAVDADGETVPRYLLFVRPLQVPNSEAVAGELRQMFGLTIGESALALSLRKKGDTAAAAADLGIATTSARTRLQSVFEKTNTHGQAELLVLLAALAETVV